MEFFAIADLTTDVPGLQEIMNLDSLAGVCPAIEEIGEEEGLGRVVYFASWGRYHLRREEIMDGVRFWVPDCPNALGWTVTTGRPPARDKVVIHATIARTGHDPEFITATEDLVEELRQGVERAASGCAATPAPLRPEPNSTFRPVCSAPT